MWGQISSRCWKSQKMYEVKEPHFVPWIPGSHCICKHTIKHCLRCGCCATFSFLFILFQGVTIFHTHTHTHTHTHAHAHAYTHPVWRYGPRCKHHSRGTVWATQSSLLFSLCPALTAHVPCEFGTAQVSNTLYNVTNLSSSIQSAETILG